MRESSPYLKYSMANLESKSNVHFRQSKAENLSDPEKQKFSLVIKACTMSYQMKWDLDKESTWNYILPEEI